MLRWLVVLACLFLSTAAASGENALSVSDQGFHHWHRTFDMWGIELADWRQVLAGPQAVYRTLMPWSDHGINTVAFALQQPGGSPFFAPDGLPADKKLAGEFTDMTMLIRDHHLASVVSLFSSERKCWLSSADAYRTAAQAAARLLGKKHSVVFVAGDLFATSPWSHDCPYPLGEPSKAVELCRLINQANPEALVAIPASLLASPSQGNADSRTPLLYVAPKAEALSRMIAQIATREPSGPVKDVVAVPASQLFRFRQAGGKPDESARQYLQQVEQTRLAVKAPMPPPKGSARDDLLSPEEKAAGWVPLFDGRTLEGWTTLRRDWAAWSVEDGAIACAGQDGQWLRSRKRYGSFILRFEYRISRNGNSGVFVWSPLEGRSSRFGVEMQIRGVHSDKPDNDTSGAIYDVLPPREDAACEAGDWNRVEITCRGSKVTFKINDRIVQDLDADKVPELQGRQRRGVIGLQDHGNQVWFRSIRIKELTKP